MLSTLSATEVAFLIMASIQAVASLAWALGAWVVADARRAAAHWATWAALSCATWLVLALRLESPPLIGVVSGVLGTLALQRGIRIWVGRRPARWLPIAALAAVVAADLVTSDPALRHLQAALNFAVLAGLYFGIAHDLNVHGRDDLHLRWSLLLALPALLGATAFASRSLRALLWPESVLAEMATHSTLNVGSALAYVVLVLLLHTTLMALVVARLVADLHRLSRHDGLTGLLNRRAMEEAVAAQVRTSQRGSERFVLMMLDVDHFKAVNDRHGHAAGDLALKHVAGRLRSGLREIDRLGRYGGEEFLVLLPGLGLAQALAVAERLREDLAASPLVHRGTSIALSVSIGVAEGTAGVDGSDDVLERADTALFRAKAAGRNSVIAEHRASDAMPSPPEARIQQRAT